MLPPIDVPKCQPASGRRLLALAIASTLAAGASPAAAGTGIPMRLSELATERTTTSQIPFTSSEAPDATGVPPQPGLDPSFAVPVSDPYILGAGDRLGIDVFEEPTLSGEQEVLVDGTISLPLVGAISVAGLTVEQATARLTQELSRFLVRPSVGVRLLTARPLKIAVVGEVNRPGSYTVSPERAGSVVQGQVLGARTQGIPNLTAILQLAGGITAQAQVREVEVLRTQGVLQTKVIPVDLWALLQLGEIDQDISLRDGDTIFIPTAPSLTAAETTQLADASFAPDQIAVNVVGEIENPGQINLTPNTSLNQALLAAGGFNDRRARKSRVTLIRLNPNGTVSRRLVPVDFDNPLNDETNPPLRNDDIIVVGRSDVTVATDTLATTVAPVNTVLNLLRTLDQLFNIFD